ncbi:MAG: hypothetical protein N4A44_05160 [Alphaproteobacteria bacterium]|jgi:hypothetical protein|nr:hypothetical protein [Alphaproteobacteria bacterium]
MRRCLIELFNKDLYSSLDGSVEMDGYLKLSFANKYSREVKERFLKDFFIPSEENEDYMKLNFVLLDIEKYRDDSILLGIFNEIEFEMKLSNEIKISIIEEKKEVA